MGVTRGRDGNSLAEEDEKKEYDYNEEGNEEEDRGRPYVVATAEAGLLAGRVGGWKGLGGEYSAGAATAAGE